MTKKKLSERVDKIRPLFDKLNVKLTDDQLITFVSVFESMKEEAVKEAVTPIQEKMEGYQKQNYEYHARLEETKTLTEKFDKVIMEKTEEISKMRIPQLSTIEKDLDKKLGAQSQAMEKKISKLEEVANRINDKIIPFKLDEELKKVQDVGKLFENYMGSFTKLLAETESNEIKALRINLEEKTKQLEKATNEVISLKEQNTKERENMQITLLLENSDLDKEEKDFLYKYAQKVEFEEAKNEVQKFITMKENKEKAEPRLPQRQLKENATGVKATTDLGFIGKKKIYMNESASHRNEMDEWEQLTFGGKEGVEKV